jgi:hypothetical protein
MLSLLNLSLLLASSSSSSAAPTFPGGILAWIICNGAKRNQIGGWLMFFFWQLYSGILVSALFFAMNIQSYVPENFESSDRFLLFLTSVVPMLIIYLAQLGVGTILLVARTWDLLKLLRWLVGMEIVASIIALVIDANYFPDNVGLNLLTLVPQALWLAYFFRSMRVKHVFKTHDWEIAVNSIYPVKPKMVS